MWVHILMAVVVAIVVFGILYLESRNSSISNQAPIDWSGITNEVSSVVNNTLDKFAEAIKNFEGKPGDLNYRNNNPGNLMYAGQPGAIGADSRGLAIFSTWDEGLAALKRQIALDASRYPQWSIYEYISNKYAPAGADNPNDVAYAQSIALALGVTPNTTLGSLRLT